MKPSSVDYAILSQASYKNPTDSRTVKIGETEYTYFAHADQSRSGFQATAYIHVNSDDSRELVIAYRGTEFDREPIEDGLTDAGMALAGVNAQTPDAMAFTRRAIDGASKLAHDGNYPLHITVTGHSLGGTLAQINAHKFGLEGETFNAYGAAGLVQGIPEGGHQVINHVRATDVVSAASRHFGEVRAYAATQDIDALSRAGYTDIPLLNQLPSHAPVLGKIQADAHAIDNFVPGSKTLGESLLGKANAERYEDHRVMVDAYRTDIRTARAVAALPGTAFGKPIAAGMAMSEKVSQAYDAARDRFSHALHDKPTLPTLANSIHPDHALFKQALQGVHKLDEQHCRAPDQSSERLAAALVVAAKREGLQRIDHVVLSDSASHAYAVQGELDSPLKRLAQADVLNGINTPIERSTEAAFGASQQHAAARESVQQAIQQQPARAAPSL